LSLFLGQLAATLGAPLEYERMLPRVARLSVPLLGDLCAVDLLDADGTIRRVACAHVDSTKEGIAYEARARYGFSPSAPHGVPAVLRDRRPAIVSPATAADLDRAARTPEQLDLLRQLGLTSWMVVPMSAREQVLGAMTLAITESGRRYGPADLLFAEAASRAKDQFLSTLSHELRTPLNTVNGWATILQRGDLDAEQTRRALQIILRNVTAQVRLMDDLLDVSRIEAGKIRLTVQPVDLRLVIEEAMDGIRPAAAAKNIRLQSVLASPVGPVGGDPDRLQQVVWNLLSNAVKFTPKGGRVQVQLQRVNSQVAITMSDSGMGIGAELLPHICERFRQDDGSSTRPHGGLGLGLALVRSLAELHAGTVFAESAGEGRGATFEVRLPLMLASPGTETARAARGQSGSLSPGLSLAGIRVLVVDDDPTAVELNREILTGVGGEVRVCAGGAEALAMLRQWRPDVLTSDIEMPGMDGYSLVRQVRALEPSQGGKTPAIALSAYSRPEDRVRSLMAGFNFHVSKPVDPSELVTSVASLAGRVG